LIIPPLNPGNNIHLDIPWLTVSAAISADTVTSPTGWGCRHRAIFAGRKKNTHEQMIDAEIQHWLNLCVIPARTAPKKRGE
jgi:hypothetical protein